MKTYTYILGRGLHFSAHSLDPNITERHLAETLSNLDGKASYDFAALTRRIVKTDHLDSIKGLKLDPQEGKYTVPEPLLPFREAIQRQWDEKGRFNGPVLIATSEIRFPLKVVQGGYYDYAATRLDTIPSELVPERYPKGETVEDILTEGGFTNEDRAKYFGFAHLMRPSNGNELLLVQRAKGMGICADCISTPGSTPDLVLRTLEPQRVGFGVEEYWSYHFAEEMKDEFHLGWGDFWTRDIQVFDDKRVIPFGVIDIATKLSTKEISEKAYGDQRVLKEHSILYSIPVEAVRTFLKRFPIDGGIARVLNMGLI